MTALAPWETYLALQSADKRDAEAVPVLDALHPEWLDANSHPRIVSLRQLHQLKHKGVGLFLLPAYAQTSYIYDGQKIKSVSETIYKSTDKIHRVNQFGGKGAAYQKTIDDIFIEYRLGCIVSDAAAYAAEHVRVATDGGTESAVALMVIDGLRTVDATYALASAHPEALASRLLATPGKSAHNKGMAVDLTLVYWNAVDGCWMDAEMFGHIDHPNMITNHRNYFLNHHTHTSEGHAGHVRMQQNRLTLERIMLRSALSQGLLLAPLREEFWDFRFPEEGLDLWRVLESVARVTGNDAARHRCAETIEAIHHGFSTGRHAEIQSRYALDMALFASTWQELFGTLAQQKHLYETLDITLAEVPELTAIYHGLMNVIYDADLPKAMQQAAF